MKYLSIIIFLISSCNYDSNKNKELCNGHSSAVTLFELDSLPYYKNCVQNILLRNHEIPVLDIGLDCPFLTTIELRNVTFNSEVNFYTWLSKMKNIKEITIENVSNESFLTNVCNFSKLEKVRLISSHGMKVPKCIFNLKELKDLTLDGAFSGLDSIIKLDKIKKLSLLNSPIQEIPECVFQLSSLEMLNLDNCKIAVIPNRLRELKGLKSIGLAGTEYEKLQVERLKQDYNYKIFSDVKNLCNNCEIRSNVRNY